MPLINAKKRRLSLQPLESRRVLAASFGWDGPGQGSAELSYYIANSPSSLTQEETNAAIQTALAAWSSAADITFTQVNQPGLRDSIDISFTNIDGAGRTLAQAYFPDDVNPARIAGDIQFDISEAWEVGNSLASRAFDLVYVAVHEIGHSLGLDHTGAAGSVLAPSVSPNQSFTSLSATDAAAIQRLYAPASVTTTTPTTTTPTTTTPTTTVPAEAPVAETPTTTTDPGDSDSDPFPRNRWRRGGNWHRFGGRLDADVPENNNYFIPTDVNGDSNTSAADALMIINELNRLANSDSTESSGLCDTNADGSVTAADALLVINVMNASSTTSLLAVLSDADVTTAGTDTADTTPIDQVDDGVTPVDDGGVTDDTDEEDCEREGHHHGPFGHQGRFALGVLGKNAEDLVARFDADANGAISESEVSSKLWATFQDLNLDADGDGNITLDELNTAITAAQKEKFDAKDTNDDGLLTQTEVGARRWERLSAADADNDQAVSFDELQSWLADQVPETVNQPGHMHAVNVQLVDRVFAQFVRPRQLSAFGRVRR